MSNEQHALQAWKDGMGDAMTAVKLLRDRTDLNLRDAVEQIQKTAAQVGVPLKVHTCAIDELPPELAEALRPRTIAELQEEAKNDPRLAEHRAARGVRKVRGAKAVN
jgi:hypothetical protein